MFDRGEFTFREILSQPEAWKGMLQEVDNKKDALLDFFKDRQFSEVIFTGCGSAHHISQTISSIWQNYTGVRVVAQPASQILLFPRFYLIGEKRSLLVAISRSGETTETVEAVKIFKKTYNGEAVAITCYGESSLTKEGAIALINEKGQEESIAQTSSISSMLIGAQSLMALANGFMDYYERLKFLPSIGERIISQSKDLAREVAENKDFNRFFFLGSGHLYGIACEAMLKMKEMALTNSESFPTLEFRHGPKSMVDESTLIIGLVSSQARVQELALLKEMKSLGAKLMVIADNLEEELSWIDYSLILNSGLQELIRPVLYLPPLQLLAYYKSMVKGLNPDRPKNVDMVVKL